MAGKIALSRRAAGIRSAFAVAALVFVLIVAGLSGCGEDEVQPAVYTEDDSGTTVKAAVGDVITVELTENPSTGYSWEFDLSAGLERRSDEFVEPTSSPGLVGAAGKRVITIGVTAAGAQSVKGVYARSWEEAAPDQQTFSLTIQAE